MKRAMKRAPPASESRNPACYGARERARFLCKSETAAGASAIWPCVGLESAPPLRATRKQCRNIAPGCWESGRRRRTTITTTTRGVRTSTTAIRTTTTRTTTIVFGRCGVLHKDGRRRRAAGALLPPFLFLERLRTASKMSPLFLTSSFCASPKTRLLYLSASQQVA